MNDTGETTSLSGDLEAADDKMISSPSVQTTLLSHGQGIPRLVDTPDGSDEGRGKPAFVYALFSFVLFLFLLLQYIIFTQLSPGSSADKDTYMIIALIFTISPKIIEEVQKYFNRNRDKLWTSTVVILTSFVLIFDTYFVGQYILEHWSTHWSTYLFTFSLWLTLIPGCYLVYHLLHHCVSVLVGFIAKCFPAFASSSRSTARRDLEDPNYFLQNAHTSISIIAMVLGLFCLLRDLLRNWMKISWFTCLLMCAANNSTLFTKNENEQFDPDGYVENAKSFVSPYFAFCSLAMIGTVLNLWYKT